MLNLFTLQSSNSEEDQVIEYLAIKPIKTPSGTKTYQCEFCHYNTNRRGNLARHIGTVHRKGRNTPSRSPYVREAQRWQQNNPKSLPDAAVVIKPPTPAPQSMIIHHTARGQTAVNLPTVRNYVPPPPAPTQKEPITIHIDDNDEEEEQYEESNYEEFVEQQPAFTWRQAGITRTSTRSASVSLVVIRKAEMTKDQPRELV